jgi:hypothetical protein
VAIDRHGGIGQLPIEDDLQQAAHLRHLVGRQRRLPIDVREARRLQQPVPLAQRRPISMKLRCRLENPARIARSNWLNPRDCRQARTRGPTTDAVAMGHSNRRPAERTLHRR